MKKRLFSILMATAFFRDAPGQELHNADSLNKILSTAVNDTLRAKAISELCGDFVYTKPDSCLYYAALGFELINNTTTRKKLASSNNFDLRFFEINLYRRS